jgi:uncharacterized SAM-binding protein YcdF (DUF218 family)
MLIFSQRILWGIGEVLVGAGAPQKADMEVVLGGDATGNRIMKGCELIRSGYVPHALVSGGGNYYGNHESTLEIEFAINRGCPPDYFIPVEFNATSTLDEAQHVILELRRAGARKVLIVTSPSHTARAARIFHRLAPDIEFHAVACRDRKWNQGYWWKTREGRKLWLLESVKTFADFLGF